MRVIFLNAWFGETKEKLLEFIRKEADSTDIFCFMEFYPGLFKKTSSVLKNWQGFLEKGMVLECFKLQDCQAIFVRKGLKVVSSGKLLLYRNTKKDTGFASYISLEVEGRPVTLLNVHGKAQPGHKKDTPARIKQSERIIDFCRKLKGGKIIGGDFNLNPDTKSVGMFKAAGYRDLIKEFGIKNTRNRLAWEQFRRGPDFVKQYFADYAFVSKDIKVKSFTVPDVEVSDHLPLILDFEI